LKRKTENPMQMRINKYIKECGLASRRQADEIIAAGRVAINGRVANAGDQVTENDVVWVDGMECKLPDTKHYVAFYKSVGVTCSKKDEHAELLLDDVFHYPFPLTYAGRLDRDSEGLLIMTDDGELIDRMMRARYGHEKEYIVGFKKDLTDDFLKSFEKGVYLKELETKTRRCKIKKIGPKKAKVVLTEGLNRQIRRMGQALGNEVTSIKRVRVVNIVLGDLKPGEYRELSEKELRDLMKSISPEK